MGMEEFDIIIAGGGMVGVTTALALAKIKDNQPLLKIALVESIEVDSNASPSFDARAVALSAASVAIYKSLDLWSELKPLAESILDIHISEQGHFGFTRLSTKERKSNKLSKMSGEINALGQVIPLDETGPVLWNAVKSFKNITTFCPNKIIKIDSLKEQAKNHKITVFLESANNKVQKSTTKRLTAKLLIAADGTFSHLAKMAEIKTERTSYSQHAIIANISTEKPHNNKAFERFTKEGPLALLPLTRNRMSLVWCQNEAHCKKTMKLDDKTFKSELQKSFGFRLGKINRVGERTSYPLSLHLPEKIYSGRILLLGNSAHTLHPIAGQGFNVGLRDIAALIDSVNAEFTADPVFDLGSEVFLEKYYQQRKPDWNKTIGATNSLVRLFSNDFFPLNSVRSKALWLVDKIPLIKDKIANVAMGFDGESAKLTRRIK